MKPEHTSPSPPPAHPLLQQILATAVVGLDNLRHTERNAYLPLEVRKASLLAQEALADLSRAVLDEIEGKKGGGS